MITVFSPKGGVGKTVVSTNLAATLCKSMGKSTLLLDLDLQFGDAAIMLGLQPDKTIYDLVVAPGELDSEKLAGYTLAHPSGLDVLAAPLQPEDAELVTEGKLARLLEVAARSYDAIIVDTSPFFHGPMLARSTGPTTCCCFAGWTCRRSRTSGSACRRSSCCSSRTSGSASS